MAQSDPALRQVGGDVKAGIGVLLATCISTLVVNANTSAVSILLPSISEDTGATIDVLQWAVTGYSLVGAAFIVTSGALGDVFGRRRIFLGGLFLFMASCVLIALSTSEWGVIGGRAIQGAAGSTILACGMSLLTVASTGAERLRAVSLWGAASAIGAAIGPLVGGVFVGTSGWQTLFWITLIVAGLCVPLTLSGVKESMDPNRSRTIDWAGTFLVAAILAPLILALSKGSDWGWGSLATIGCLVVSIAAAVGFVYVERRSEAPLVDLALLRNRVLIGATLGILIGAGTINGLMFLLSIYFQEPSTLGMTALEAGLATLPAAAGMVILAPLVPKIANKIGTRQAVGLGFIAMTAGFAVLIGTKADWAYAVFVLPVVAIAAGMALSNGPCSSASTSAVPEAQVGSASGISNMARYVGASVWTAVVAAIYSSVTADRAASGAGDAESLAAALGAACVFLTITSALGILLAWLAGRHRPPAPLPVDLAASAASGFHTIEIPHPDSPERAPAVGTA
jgi:EmrB/QacA subfamily drug resistance transporter